MRRWVGWVGVLWLVAGCTVPELEELGEEKPRTCNPAHRCARGYACLQGTCVPCQESDVIVAYPDADGDGYGAAGAASMSFCGSVERGYVLLQGDCDDTHVGSNPGVAELCDGRDNDCDSSADEDFPLKGTACSDPCTGGQYVCDASQTDLECAAPARVALFPDSDGDGAGDELASISASVCPGETVPTGTAANADDCDDLDPHNRRGRPEVCDGRDNTCDNASDEGDVCQGKGWKVLEDPALTGNRQWKTVALGVGGFPVWVAGDGGVLAVREAAGQPFRSLDGSCGTHSWTTAWVRPTDGLVFLGGVGGLLAQHDGTSCFSQTVPPATASITGIIGFPPSVTLYVVNTAGRLFTWAPPAAPVERFNLSPEAFIGLHGLAPTLLLGVGYTEETPARPHVIQYVGSGTTVRRHAVQVTSGPYEGGLRGVWTAGPRLAYAVGDDGLVVKWDGEMAWTSVPPPTDNPLADFTSVVMLDASSVYTADTGGFLRRRDARGWVTPSPHSGNQPLRDIAASSSSDIWAVGDNGRVVHFPE